MFVDGTCRPGPGLLAVVAGLAILAHPGSLGAQEDRGEEIASLIKRLGTVSHASDAADALARIGRPAVPAVIEAMRGEDPAVRQWAILTLGRMGPVDEAILPALMETIPRVGFGVTFEDADGLTLAGVIGGMNPTDLTPIVAFLSHEKVATRGTAASTLAACTMPTLLVDSRDQRERVPVSLPDEAIGPLLELLRDDDFTVRSAAIQALAQIKPDHERAGEVIAAVAGRLDDIDENIRAIAAHALAQFGPRAAVALDALKRRFESEETHYIQFAFAEAIGKLGAKAEPALPMLIEASRSRSLEMREHAVLALALMSKEVEAARPPLRAALADPEFRVRRYASEALAALDGPEIPGFIEALGKPDVQARKGAAGALRSLGPDAAPAIPALIAALADRHEGVLRDVVWALEKIGAPAVPALIDALGHDDPAIRLGAAEVLGRIGMPAAVPAGDRLATLAKSDPDAEVRRFAGLAVVGLRVEAPGSADMLFEAMKREKEISDQRYHDVAGRIGGNLAATAEGPALAAALDVAARLSEAGEFSTFAGLLGRRGPAVVPALVEALGRASLHRDLGESFGTIGAAAVPALTEALKSENATRRAGAALGLDGVASGEHPAAVLPAVPALVEALHDESPDVRSNAASALGSIEAPDRDVVLALVRLLADPDEGPAGRAAVALRYMKSKPVYAIPDLIELLGRGDRAVSLRAGEALGEIGPEAAPELVRVLRTGDRVARLGASHGLCSMDLQLRRSISEIVVIPLAEAIKDEDRSVGNYAAHALKFLHEAAEPAVPILIANLEHKSARVRIESAEVLAHIGPKAAAATPRLIELLRDEKARDSAAAALTEIGDPALPGLFRALIDSDPSVRAASSSALGGPKNRSYGYREFTPNLEVVRPLLTSLNDPSGSVRAAAAASLGRIATSRHYYAPRFLRRIASPQVARLDDRAAGALAESLDDPDPAVRRAAAAGLKALGPGARVPLDALVPGMGDPDPEVRAAVAEVLAGHGRAAIPHLELACRSSDPRVRAAAVHACGCYRPSGSVAFGLAVHALDDPDRLVSGCAIEEIARLAYRLPERRGDLAISPLIRALGHPDAKARMSALRALASIGEVVADRDGEVIPAIASMLRDPDPRIRMKAAESFQTYGHRAEPALPALRKALDDPSEEVRRMARHAMDCIIGG